MNEWKEDQITETVAKENDLLAVVSFRHVLDRLLEGGKVSIPFLESARRQSPVILSSQQPTDQIRSDQIL